MHLAELKNEKEILSPLWGGLGWGSLRSIHSCFFSTFKMRATPTPTLPTRGRGKSFAVPILKVNLFCIGAMLYSGQAFANSYFIQLFDGEWRSEGQICSGFKKTDPYLSFGYDGEEFASFGTSKCALASDWLNKTETIFKIQSEKKCRKNGFPTEYIGKFIALQLGDEFLEGHLLLIRNDGSRVRLKNCRLHK